MILPLRKITSSTQVPDVVERSHAFAQFLVALCCIVRRVKENAAETINRIARCSLSAQLPWGTHLTKARQERD
jgi:hypothetical protein